MKQWKWNSVWNKNFLADAVVIVVVERQERTPASVKWSKNHRPKQLQCKTPVSKLTTEESVFHRYFRYSVPFYISVRHVVVFFRDSQRLGSLIIYSSVFLCICWLALGVFLTLPNHICLHSLVFSLPTFASIHSFKSSYRRKFNRESVAFNEINFDSICWNIHELFKAFSHIATYFTFSWTVCCVAAVLPLPYYV